MRNLVAMFISAAILCGCGSNPRWRTQTFAFSMPADPPRADAPTNIVALNRFSVSPLFQSRSFTYRTADNTYVQDPYAEFLVSPERAVAEPIRAWMRNSGALGRAVEAGSSLTPTVGVEATVTELCGDFRKTSQPVASMQIRFIVYQVNDGSPGPIMLDKVYACETPLARKTPAALMAAWDTDLREIMGEVESDYAKAHSNDSGR
jgi:ABC-type uncharacterized transport system auxiliary subunit